MECGIACCAVQHTAIATLTTWAATHFSYAPTAVPRGGTGILSPYFQWLCLLAAAQDFSSL